jgi:hypothetical protein
MPGSPTVTFHALSASMAETVVDEGGFRYHCPTSGPAPTGPAKYSGSFRHGCALRRGRPSRPRRRLLSQLGRQLLGRHAVGDHDLRALVDRATRAHHQARRVPSARARRCALLGRSPSSQRLAAAAASRPSSARSTARRCAAVMDGATLAEALRACACGACKVMGAQQTRTLRQDRTESRRIEVWFSVVQKSRRGRSGLTGSAGARRAARSRRFCVSARKRRSADSHAAPSATAQGKRMPLRAAGCDVSNRHAAHVALPARDRVAVGRGLRGLHQHALLDSARRRGARGHHDRPDATATVHGMRHAAV